jgi:hypothetical protein
MNSITRIKLTTRQTLAALLAALLTLPPGSVRGLADRRSELCVGPGRHH